MKNYLILSFLVVFSLKAFLSSEWEYSKAIRSAQEEQWKDAQERMSGLMVHDPDNPELLYDSGVASYKVKEYPKAEAYFYQTAHNELATAALKEKAFFNLGNTKVALNELKEAIEPYESALAIDPEDEQARHNLGQVRKALEEQEKELEKDPNGQYDMPDENEKGDPSSAKAPSFAKATADKPADRQQDGTNEQQQSSDSQGEQNDSQDKENGHQGDKQQQDKQESAADEQQKEGADQQQEGDQKEDAAEKSDGEQRAQDQDQRGDTHDSSPQKNDEQDEKSKARDADIQDRKGREESQEMQAGEVAEQESIEDMLAQQQKELEEGLDPKDRWMVRVLRQREQADEQANKQIVKSMIDKELAGQDGQNCW